MALQNNSLQSKNVPNHTSSSSGPWSSQGVHTWSPVAPGGGYGCYISHLTPIQRAKESRLHPDLLRYRGSRLLHSTTLTFPMKSTVHQTTNQRCFTSHGTTENAHWRRRDLCHNTPHVIHHSRVFCAEPSAQGDVTDGKMPENSSPAFTSLSRIDFTAPIKEDAVNQMVGAAAAAASSTANHYHHQQSQVMAGENCVDPCWEQCAFRKSKEHNKSTTAIPSVMDGHFGNVEANFRRVSGNRILSAKRYAEEERGFRLY